jgi:hypothetical protein
MQLCPIPQRPREKKTGKQTPELHALTNECFENATTLAITPGNPC